MQIRKACYMCNMLASFTCKKCARPVCKNDYNNENGLCGMCNMPRHIKR